jgi:site-specific DNA-methyltransferase (adenine-specific)
MPARSVDLVFADPPFNWGVDYGRYKDNLPRESYLGFTKGWLEECERVLTPHGSLWVNIPDDTAAEVAVLCKALGLHIINWCIWHFRFGQCRRGNFIVSKVHALYFCKNLRLRTWNAAEVMEPGDRAAVYGDQRTNGSATPGLRVPLDVWYGPNWGRVQGNNAERRPGHANQLPEAYLERVVLACSNPGDLVLDPFMGSGTTCTVARALGRRSIGIELDPALAASAWDRVKSGPARVRSL